MILFDIHAIIDIIMSFEKILIDIITFIPL